MFSNGSTCRVTLVPKLCNCRLAVDPRLSDVGAKVVQLLLNYGSEVAQLWTCKGHVGRVGSAWFNRLLKCRLNVKFGCCLTLGPMLFNVGAKVVQLLCSFSANVTFVSPRTQGCF